MSNPTCGGFSSSQKLLTCPEGHASPPTSPEPRWAWKLIHLLTPRPSSPIPQLTRFHSNMQVLSVGHSSLDCELFEGGGPRDLAYKSKELGAL